jgi:MFS family permease
MICNMIPLLIIARATTLSALLVAAFIQSFGHGACMPALQALTMKSVTPDRRGAASSTNYIGFDMGSLIGPTLVGSIVQGFGYDFMWHIMVIPSIAGGIMLYLSRNAILRIEEDFAAQPL